MSRFTQWYVAEQLGRMGWPKPKDIFRKHYVDTRVLDILVEQAIHISVGLGAGRPQCGIAVLADTFANNPWTRESTVELLRHLKEDGEHEIANNPRFSELVDKLEHAQKDIEKQAKSASETADRLEAISYSK